MTLLFACACGAIGSNIYYAQPLLVAIAQTFHRTPASLGFLVTATQLGYACALLAIVPLGDVLDRRKLARGWPQNRSGPMSVAGH
jgi:predicted MFS family arabinose efflux permease